MYKLSLFGHRRKNLYVLIDVGSASISGAYANIEEGHHPTIYYSTHISISLRDDISPTDAIAQALTKITKDLLVIGAPVVSRYTNKKIHIDHVIVSITAPWQDIRVQMQQKIEKKSFRFTKEVMDNMVMETFAQSAQGRVITNSMVVSINLNGYSVTNPFGIKTKEVKMIVLGSYITKEINECVTKIVTEAFHIENIEITAFAPIASSVLRSIYPNEKDMLIIDITGEMTDVILVKDGILTDIAHTKRGLNVLRKSAIDAGIRTVKPSESFHAMEHAVLMDKEHNARFTARLQQARALWLQDIAHMLQNINVQYVLPRSVFILVDEEASSFIRRQFNEEPILKKMWLSSDKLSIITIDAKRLLPFVISKKESHDDPFLSILALYAVQK